jgi:hypothetical protein
MSWLDDTPDRDLEPPEEFERPEQDYDDYRQQEIDDMFTANEINEALSIVDYAARFGLVEEDAAADGVWTAPGEGAVLLGAELPVKYRAKQAKPREWWMCWDGDGDDVMVARSIFPSPEYDGCVDHWENQILVREVL